MTLQRSALHPIATAAGSHFQERFGWELPRLYADPALEYRAATEAVAVHDASYVGRLKATGRDVLDLLNRISTNRVLSLQPGQGAPTILTTDRGRILDLIAVVNTGDYILLITSPGNQQRVIDWLDKYTIMEDVTVQDVTSWDTMLVVLGPSSQAVLESLSGVALGGLLPFHTAMVPIGGREVRLIRRPLGVLPSFDLLVSPDGAPGVWQALVESGATPIGVEALDAVRVRYAVPSYGREMGEAFNPLETGLIGSIDFAKGCYIGQEVIARLDTYHKVQRSLVTLRFPADTQVAEGVTLRHGERSVGAITSVARIPTTGQVIGLGYVRTEAATIGARLELEEVPDGWAEIEALPELFGPGKD
jgi:folate-binding protein YgfZ